MLNEILEGKTERVNVGNELTPPESEPAKSLLVPVAIYLRRGKYGKGKYVVEVLRNANGDKVYKCPSCKYVSGTLVVETKNPDHFHHILDCPNKFSTPVEPEGPVEPEDDN